MTDEDNIQTASSNQAEENRFSHQREWIVKANNKILGPFTYEEVVQNIKDHRFVLHDEIIAPKGRWKLLKQEEKFREIVNEARNSQSSSGGGSDITLTQTATEAIELAEDAIKNTQQLMKGVKEQVKKTNQKDQESDQDTSLTRDAAKNFAYKKDLKVKKKFSQIERIKIFAALFFFVLAGLFALVRGIQKSGDGSQRVDSFQDLINQGQTAEKTGEFTKALSFYNDARNIKPNDNLILSKIAPLILIQEKQVLQASRMFKQIIDTDPNPERKKAALLGMGLASLEAHELDPAFDYFTKVLNIDAQNMPAVFNAGVVQYYRDKFEDAENFMKKALDKGGNNGAVVLAMADVNSVSQGKLDAAHAMLKAYLEVSQDYRPQVLVQDARILGMLNRTNEATKVLENILELDPEYVESFDRNWQVYSGRATWEQTLENLKKAWGAINVGPHANAIEGLIMYWGREKLDGAQMIEKALAQSPKDPQLMAIAGWVQLKLGRREVGVNNIKEAVLASSSFKLPKIIAAKLCYEDKDFQCAEKNWEEILKVDQKNLGAYLGLAQIAWSKKDAALATKWLRQGQAMDSKFLPFAALDLEITNQNQADDKK